MSYKTILGTALLAGAIGTASVYAAQPTATQTPIPKVNKVMTLKKDSPGISDLLARINSNIASVKIYDRGTTGLDPLDVIVAYDAKGKEIFRTLYLAKPTVKPTATPEGEPDFGGQSNVKPPE